MSGKGSRPRPLTVSKKQFDENFDRIFGKREDPEEDGYELLPDVCDAQIEYIKITDEPLNIKKDS